MTRYHINGRGEAGICRAKHSCPFGDEKEHYSSRAEAQLAYEQKMSVSPTSILDPAEAVENFVAGPEGSGFLMQEIIHPRKGARTIALDGRGRIFDPEGRAKTFGVLETAGWEKDGEAYDPRPQKLVDELEGSLPLRATLSKHAHSGHVSIDALVIAKDFRQKGLGTQAMERIVAAADANSWILSLSPSTDFGATSKKRLEKFYRRFGFVSNHGRHKDFTINEEMLRLPREPTAQVVGQAKSTVVDTSYRTWHHASPNGARGDDLNDVFPGIYSHSSWHRTGETQADEESLAAIRRMRNRPDFEVTVYRALPASAEQKINEGDWVSLSPSYCRSHAAQSDDPNEDWPVISAKVAARMLRSDGDSINEFGFFPAQAASESNFIVEG